MKISQIVVLLEGKNVDVSGVTYVVKAGALYLPDSTEKVTPRKLGTTWNEIFEKSEVSVDEVTKEPTDVASILAEVAATKVAVTPREDKPVEKSKAKSNPTGNSGNLEYYTTPPQKEFLIEVLKSSENETVKWLHSCLVEKEGKASVVKITPAQIVEIDEEFEKLIEGNTDKRVGALRKKHEALKGQ